MTNVRLILADWDSHPNVWRLSIPYDNSHSVERLDRYWINIVYINGLVSLIIGNSRQSTTQMFDVAFCEYGNGLGF